MVHKIYKRKQGYSLLVPNLSYRRDIDGLRAVAVLAVILFHAEFELFAGGFVGVDIFFVISGYLITQRIIIGHEAGGFNFKQFYIRRIRRLFPAMVSTVLGTILVGAILLDPNALVSLSWSAISAIFSVANIHYFYDTGYWDTESWSKPLLHTWSLGVEEQFYIFWPFVIIGLLSYAKRFSFFTLLTVTIISLLFTSFYTSQNTNAAFYLTPFRVYEFGIGAICVWFDRYSWNNGLFARAGQSIIFVLGLLLIVFSIILLSKADNFPGWIAVIPTLGAAFVILAKNPLWLGYLLSNPVFRYIGQISYSLYLVHWPVLVFIKQEWYLLTTDIFVLAIGIIFSLSVLQYHLVEIPLRRSSTYQKGRCILGSPTFFSGGIATILVISVSLFIIANNGLPSRYSEELQGVVSLTLEGVNQKRFHLQNKICSIKRTNTICGKIKDGVVNVLVVGDSHGPDGLNMFVSGFPDANYLVANRGGCPLSLDLTEIKYSFVGCADYNKRRLEDIDSIYSKLDYVIFSQRMSVARIKPMINTFDWFARRDIEIIVLGAGPQYVFDVVPMIIKNRTFEGVGEKINAKAYTSHYRVDDELEAYVQNILGGLYLRKRNYFCPDNICAPVLKSGTLLMYDKHHLTLDASKEFGIYIALTNIDILKSRR